jgi:hypothetical protein
MKLRRLIIVISFAFPNMLLSQYNAGNDAKKTVLVVDDIFVTKYELDKYMFRNKNRNNGRKGQYPDEIKRLISNFIDDYYFLAEAVHQGFENHADVKEKVSSYSHFFMTQLNGPLYKTIIEDSIFILEKDIFEARKKRTKAIDISILEFVDSETYKIFLRKNTNIAAREDLFDPLRTRTEEKVKLFNLKLIWPYLLFSRTDNDNIFDAQVNDILGPLFSDGKYYLVLIKQISDYHDSSSEEVQLEMLNNILKIFKRKELEQKHYNQINMSSKIYFYDKTIDFFVSKLIGLSSPDQISQGFFISLLKMQLMKYSIDSVTKCIDVNSFLTYYKYLPVKFMLKSRQDILHYLRNMVYEEYEYALAIRLKIDQSESFRLNLINYRRQLLIKNFKASVGQSADSVLVFLKTKYLSNCFIDYNNY